MLIGWLLPLVGIAIDQVATFGKPYDVGVTAFWIGLFSLIAWAVFVLPIVTWFGDAKWLSALRWSWLGWSVLAVVAFVLLLTPGMGLDAFMLVWYPAAMGCIVGIAYPLLLRMRRSQKPDQPILQPDDSEGPTRRP